MQREIVERAWSAQVFSLPELWADPLRGSNENKLWTGENYYDTETKLKQKKE